MEAYRIDRFGSVDGIVLRSSEDPRPGPKEILMQVRAGSLNYRDLMVLKGGGRGPTKIGVVPLSDGAGEVAAIGDGVTRVKLQLSAPNLRAVEVGNVGEGRALELGEIVGGGRLPEVGYAGESRAPEVGDEEGRFPKNRHAGEPVDRASAVVENSV
jgi:hypothetical protein